LKIDLATALRRTHPLQHRVVRHAAKQLVVQFGIEPAPVCARGATQPISELALDQVVLEYLFIGTDFAPAACEPGLARRRGIVPANGPVRSSHLNVGPGFGLPADSFFVEHGSKHRKGLLRPVLPVRGEM